MCINCNLITPITDNFADYIGVEKRKYLVQGCTVAEFIFKNGIENTNSNELYNFKTVDFFYPDMQSLKKRKITKDEITFTIYEGKIKVLGVLQN